MKYLNLIIAFLFIHSLSAQYSDIDNTVVFNYDIDYDVTLDTSIAINKNHVLSDYIVAQDEDYIEWLYRLNDKKNESSNKEMLKSNIISDKGQGNSLIFTLTRDGEIMYDTIANLVEINIESKPKKIGFFRKIWNKITMPNVRKILDDQNIQGSLPEGCMSWVSVSRSRLKCGIEIVKPSSEVVMVLKNKEDEVVHTFVDGILHRGWNNYKWNRGNNKKGSYLLSITVDGECMTQNVKID